ncbi:MAG: uroporphyrinogen-III synthase [Candidatus Bathyarchaeia archaeon]
MPLNGLTVVVTRPAEQAAELASLITGLGGIPRIVPTVEIGLAKNLNQVTKFLRSTVRNEVDVVIFMSQNGVVHLLDAARRVKLADQLVHALERSTVVAIGPKTAQRLREHGIRVDVVPSHHSSVGIAKEISKIGLEGKVVGIPRTDKPSDYLRKQLDGFCKKVLEVPIYETKPPSNRAKVVKLIEDLSRGEVDIITFTSSATAENLFKTASEQGTQSSLRDCLNKRVTVAAIGCVTQRTLERLGVKADVVPNEFTIDAMMKAIEAYVENNASIEKKHSVSVHLDDDDRKIIHALQNKFPLVSRPWAKLALRIGLSEEEMLIRLQRLTEQGVIRKIGPTIDAKKIGLTSSTLVALRLTKVQVEKAAQIINEYPEISHNYEREHDYNLWFTITARSRKEVDSILRNIMERIKIEEENVMELPSIASYKIDARFHLR